MGLAEPTSEVGPAASRMGGLARSWAPRGIKRRVAHRTATLLRWEGARFDRRLGVETAGGVPVAEATLVGGEASAACGIAYLGQPPRLIRYWLRALPARLDEVTFIDVGSAKGRVLFAAAPRGFRRVIGVENVRELHEVAVANLSRYRGERADAIELHLGDAAAFEFPLDPLVVHFANPFTEKVMQRVIVNLTASYERAPRPIVATYFQSWHERPDRSTANVELLAAAAPFASHRLLPKERLLDRLLLLEYRVDLFESPEAIAANGG